MDAAALDWTAVIAGVVAGFAFGAVVYHPRVLGTIWARGSGVPLDGRPPVLAFLLQILALLALAMVISMMAAVQQLGAALLAILAAMLFVASSGVFQRKSFGAVATDMIYIIGAGILMIVAQALL